MSKNPHAEKDEKTLAKIISSHDDGWSQGYVQGQAKIIAIAASGIGWPQWLADINAELVRRFGSRALDALRDARRDQGIGQDPVSPASVPMPADAQDDDEIPSFDDE